MKYPLEGIRVLEWGIYHAGPGGAAILGDLGADVIKIEQRGVGDPIRQRTRFGRTTFGLPGDKNLFFEGANRNKKSIEVDLSQKQGREIVYRLIPHFDVFLVNLRRKTIEKMGMTYSELKQLNPTLIYLSVSCYGPQGPDKDKGGFDFQGQARSGIMHSMGESVDSPAVLHFGMIDQVTAISVSQAILAALLMRERTGIGQEIQTSILGSALQLAYFNFLYGLWFHKEIPRHRRTDTDPIRNFYRSKDGKWFNITLQPGNDWGRLCKAIGRPELEDDPRFSTPESRGEVHSGELISILDDEFATRTRQEWLNILQEQDLFACRVNRTDELENDPQIRANYLDQIEHPTMGEVEIPGFHSSFSQARVGTSRSAPELGQDSVEVLRDLGGYTKEEIEQLKQEQVI